MGQFSGERTDSRSLLRRGTEIAVGVLLVPGSLPVRSAVLQATFDGIIIVSSMTAILPSPQGDFLQVAVGMGAMRLINNVSAYVINKRDNR